MSNLKPCPFCGEKPIVKKSNRFPRPACNRVDGYTIVCQNLNCIGYNADAWYELSEKKAMAAWNTRYERKCRIENILDRRDKEGRRLQTFILSCGHKRTVKLGERFGFCDQCGAEVI